MEGAGVVIAVGPGVTAWREGDRVAWSGVLGSYAERVLLPADRAVAVPPGVETRTRPPPDAPGHDRAVPLLRAPSRSRRGTPASSTRRRAAWGSSSCRWRRRAGRASSGRSATEAKAALAREAGADEVILYTQEDFLEAVKRLTGGRGVDVVYDAVGKTTAEKSLDCLVPRGMMVFYGNASGPVPPDRPARPLAQGLALPDPPVLMHYIADRASLEARAADVLGEVAAGRLKVRIDRTYPSRGGGRGAPGPRGASDERARCCSSRRPGPAEAEEAMRAAVTEAFGGVDRIVLHDRPRPVPGRGEALVRVRAAAMNPLDTKLREGKFRLIFRLKPPFVLGFDLAGEVESVGPGVSRLRPGDAVFGTLSRPGAHAEYAVGGEELLLPKPARLSFEEAAALPAAAASALQILRDDVRLRAGQRVLLNGAGGGIGTFAIQIAKAWGARVTAVASAGNQGLLRELGADEGLDYAREDFARREAAFDAIVDLVPNRSFPECRRALAPGGTYVTTLPGPGPLLWRALTILPFFAGRRCRALMLVPKRSDLEEIVRLVEAGTLRAVVSEVFSLDAIREAHLRMQSGHARGKIVVRP